VSSSGSSRSRSRAPPGGAAMGVRSSSCLGSRRGRGRKGGASSQPTHSHGARSASKPCGAASWCRDWCPTDARGPSVLVQPPALVVGCARDRCILQTTQL